MGNYDKTDFDNIYRRLTTPLWGVLLFSILTMFGLVFLATSGQDQNAISSSVKLAHAAFASIDKKVATITRETAYWDQAVDNLVTTVNPVWADDNLGPHLNETYGTSSSYVIRGNNQVVYSSIDGERKADDPFVRFSGGLDTLMRKVRSGSPSSGPTPATGLIHDTDGIHIAAVAALTTYFTKNGEDIIQATDSALLLTRKIDEDVLSELADNYLLHNLQIELSPETTSKVSIPLFAVDSSQIGIAFWEPDLPGKQILFVLIVSIFGVLALIGAVVVLFLHRVKIFSLSLEQKTVLLTQQATIDQVTGLPNRALLFDRLSQAIEQARREDRKLCLFFADLDMFKEVNDTLGHAAGDLLLKKVGERLSQIVRNVDTVARLGGDEFIILINNIELASAPEIVAKNILESLALPFDLDGHQAFVTVSLGAAVFPDDGEKAEHLLQHADAAMYQSKHQGRNTFRLFTTEENDQSISVS